MDRDDYVTGVGARVKQWRAVRGLTLRQLASQCDTDHSNLSKLEVGGTSVSLARLSRIAQALNVPLGVLVDASLPFVPVIGRTMAAGVWMVGDLPMFGGARVYPLVLPRPIAGATCAFESGPSFVICTDFDASGDPVPAVPYVVHRVQPLTALGGSPDPQPVHEVAVRVFHADEAAQAQDQPGIARRRPGTFVAPTGHPADLSIARDPEPAGIWRVICRLIIAVRSFPDDPQSGPDY